MQHTGFIKQSAICETLCVHERVISMFMSCFLDCMNLFTWKLTERKKAFETFQFS